MADGIREENFPSPAGGDEKNRKPDLIRQEYKRYKKKNPPPDFSEVIDFEDPQSFRGHVSEFPLRKFPHSNFGLRCAREWKVYHLDGLESCPGLIFIVNPFIPGAQQFWSRRCIEDFPRKPNVCNLDAHMTIGHDQSVWELSQCDGEHHGLIDRLRWVHLGYQFDYNIVDYKPETYFGFPQDLAGLMQHVAEAIDYPGYIPETGIVNYYPLATSMGGHTDHYELDLSWPLISVSFGQTAIFLIGGKTRDVHPSALFIRSGDILIMSAESRLAFHAVPRIVKVGDENQAPECLQWSKETKKITHNEDTSQEIHEDLAKITLQNGHMDKVSDMQNEPKNFTPKGTCNGENIVICLRNLPATNTTSPLSLEDTKPGNAQIGMDCRWQLENTNLDKEHKLLCCSQCHRSTFMANVPSMTEKEWQPFSQYLSRTRININVRQVHSSGNTVSTPNN